MKEGKAAEARFLGMIRNDCEKMDAVGLGGMCHLPLLFQLRYLAFLGFLATRRITLLFSFRPSLTALPAHRMIQCRECVFGEFFVVLTHYIISRRINWSTQP